MKSFLIVLGLIQFSVAYNDQDWNLNNCPKDVGVVTDAICCEGNNYCNTLSDEDKCNADGDPYCGWFNDECRPLEDSKSDVCCKEKDVKDVCDSVLKGHCPQAFQVDEDCCPDRKYAFLKSDDSKVCCNAPCKEMEEANCTNLPDKCAPQQRSYAMYNPYEMLGFHHQPGVHVNRKFGRIIYGTGYGNDLGYGYRRFKPGKYGGYKEEDDFDYSKDSHVNEITLDDVFLLLIEGLEKQTDVKVYDADITSDPYLGKRKSGGLFLDHHFPDPEQFFDEIYGEKGQYDHFIRPFEGFTKLYPEYQIMNSPHHGPYRYPDHSSYYGSPVYQSYYHHEPLGHVRQGYEPIDHSYPGYPPPSYERLGHEPQGHYW